MLKKLAIAALAVALVLGLGSALSRSADSDPAATITQLDELDAGHGLAPLPEVIDVWQARVDQHPLDYLSRTQLGAALTAHASETADLDLYAAAQEVLRDALALNPRHTPARLGLARTMIAEHDFAAAADEARTVLASAPGSLPALALLGDATLELGEYEDAADAYNRLVTAERSPATVSRLARLRFALGDPSAAVGLASEALAGSQQLALRPAMAAFYWFQLGHYQFESGNVDLAIASYEAALALDPDNPGAGEELAFALASVGRLDEAAAAYEQLISAGPAADIHGLYADVLRGLGDDVGAAEQERLGAALAAETLDRYPAERRHLAGFYLTRDPEVAVELAAADAATRNDVGALDTLAWALHNAGRTAEALDLIDEALAVGTRDAAILYHAGAIAAANGDPAAARSHIEDALALNPTFHPTEAADARRLLASLG